jgi:hypothetical protein
MTQKDEKRDEPPPCDEDTVRQLQAARLGAQKYKEALRELAKG